jgi:hypothetical protein
MRIWRALRLMILVSPKAQVNKKDGRELKKESLLVTKSFEKSNILNSRMKQTGSLVQQTE